MPVDDRETEVMKLFPVGAIGPGHLLNIHSQHHGSNGWKKPLEVSSPTSCSGEDYSQHWTRSAMAFSTKMLTSKMKIFFFLIFQAEPPYLQFVKVDPYYIHCQ